MVCESVRKTVLVVDDVPANIDVLVQILRTDYRVKAATGGKQALKIASLDDPPDLVLLDVMMPDMDGYEVCRRLKSDRATRRIPVMFVTSKTTPQDEAHGLELGAVDYVTKPASAPIVLARVRTQLALHDQNRVLEEKVRERTEELMTTRLEIIRRLGRAGEFKDNETGLHVIRMSHYSRLIARAAGLSVDEADLILNVAPMHDIGKIGIPDRILLKPGKLDRDEWSTMQRHCEIGGGIMGDHPSTILSAARTVALTHHEKWNGKGYPEGLVGRDIPRIGRIVAVADVFDALTSERPYKKAWPVDKAQRLIQSEAGQHFDPALTTAFFEVMPQILEIKDEYADPSSIDDARTRRASAV